MFTVEGLDPEGMALENASALHAQAVWDSEFLTPSSGFDDV